jgi:hypothetical protein
VQRRLHEDERDDGDRKRDEEVPAPAPGIRDHTAEQGAADRGERHDTAEQAHVAAALARADDVGHEHLAERGEAAGADALHARNAMSISGLVEKPAAAVASTKITIASW